MIRTLLATVLIACILSCSTSKQIEKSLSVGNYDQAIYDAIGKLRTNKDKKGKSDFIVMLQEAYNKANERDLTTIDFMKKDNNPENYLRIYDMYVGLNRRQETIKPLLPLAINGRTVKFDLKDFSSDIIKFKNDASLQIYNNASALLKSQNNLELVKSLIALQSAQLEDSATKDAMIASQNRVQSMGIIHQKLYQGENLGSIEMKDYFLNLGEGILDTFNADDKVKIECAMDRLELDVDTAVPIGLIVNELLTNALKYAFPENAKGNISISLSKSNPETLTLKVVDNGMGKTAGLAPKGTGFGSQLIKLLTQQLNGEMMEKNQNGTSVLFHFKLNTAA
uniref:sensor histidine kinase n=1 Tax=Mariniflexile sp. TaxID=1979402 RepID=UPI00404781FC